MYVVSDPKSSIFWILCRSFSPERIESPRAALTHVRRAAPYRTRARLFMRATLQAGTKHKTQRKEEKTQTGCYFKPMFSEVPVPPKCSCYLKLS